jgi:hypothetical protein
MGRSVPFKVTKRDVIAKLRAGFRIFPGTGRRTFEAERGI